MNAYVFTSTLRDMLRPGRIVVWVLLGVVLALISLLWQNMSRNPVGDAQYGLLVRLIVYRLVALAAAMFTVSVVSQEIEQKTIVYMVTRTVPRSAMVASRALSAVVAVTLTSWISLVGVALVMLGPDFVTRGMFWKDMLVMLLGAAAYTSLFVLITLLINRAMIAILLFCFVWESFVPYLKGDMYLLSVNTYMSVLADHPNKAMGAVTAMQGDTTVIASWVAWLVLLAVSVGLLWLNGWWFSRFQYLPREDAE
jgi:ABC-2 type transport system permease protein